MEGTGCPLHYGKTKPGRGPKENPTALHWNILSARESFGSRPLVQANDNLTKETGIRDLRGSS